MLLPLQRNFYAFFQLYHYVEAYQGKMFDELFLILQIKVYIVVIKIQCIIRPYNFHTLPELSLNHVHKILNRTKCI